MRKNYDCRDMLRKEIENLVTASVFDRLSQVIKERNSREGNNNNNNNNNNAVENRSDLNMAGMNRFVCEPPTVEMLKHE